jgi:hypothetical protein
MRMRVARPHRSAAVLEDLDVPDALIATELGVLVGPYLDDALNRSLWEVAEPEIVPRGVADHTTGAVLSRAFREECREVVREHEGAIVLGVLRTACARVAGAEIAVRIMLGQMLGRGRLDLTLPGSLRSLRRYEHMLSGERIAAPVGVYAYTFGLHCAATSDCA